MLRKHSNQGYYRIAHMKKLLVSICLFASAALAQYPEIVFFRGIMSPLNEVPAVNLQAGAPTTLICHIVRDVAGGKIISASMDFVVGYGFPGPQQFSGLHVHAGAAGVNGPIVIRTSLGSPAPVPSDPSGFGLINLQGQVLPTDQTGLDALTGMLENPSQYYVNLHTTTFPGGVVRAQLNRATFVVPILLMTPG
ncbi:MAG: CHRD domain-containing protein [Bryobacterales bacterium]|nr:CHRD domain-containing protein [Bryobacterales bacterium]